MTVREYHRKYMKEWAKKARDFNIKPTTNAKFKHYYDEYKTIKQQEGEPAVRFQEFILQYCEIGYLNWRDKVKGK